MQATVPLRKLRAQATRARMRDAATALFVERGYRGTTMQAIAQRSGVAVQTVYFTFHTKADLFAEVLKGAGGEPGDTIEVTDRTWVAEMMAERDPTRMLALLTDNGSDIFRRVAPLIEAMMAAGREDEAVGAVVRNIFEKRRAGQRRAMEALASKGGLREGASVEYAADVLYALQSAPLYQTFTSECGWSPERYKAWLFDTLAAALLPKHATRPAVIARALKDRSFRMERPTDERRRT